jgi:hypothetical protein
LGWFWNTEDLTQIILPQERSTPVRNTSNHDPDLPNQFRNTRLVFAVALLLLTVAITTPRLASAKLSTVGAGHAVSGVVKSVDSATKTAVIDTGEGVEVAVKYTGKTVVKGAKATAKAVDVGTLKGAHVIVHYTDKGAEKTATAIKYFGKDVVVKSAKGTVVGVDKAAKAVSIAAEDGSVTIYKLSKDAAVETADGAVDAAEYTGKGTKVVAHYTDDGASKTVHFIKHI